MSTINSFVLKHIRTFEMIGVVMRIFSFSLVSWLGPNSPFMFVWIFNTIDAILLSWCAILKKGSGILSSKYFLDLGRRGWNSTSGELAPLVISTTVVNPQEIKYGYITH